jgi:serine/threonine protein kinase
MTQSSWIGQTIGGRYEIQELLGQGGMSAVYKANDPNLRRIVAIKIIHPHLSSDAQFVRRFEEEAAAVAQLRHPNLIQVFDFNHDEETYFIVFEFVPGETVQGRLKRMKTAERPMDVAQAVDIAAQTADGLQYAHQKGLIHRDIKPANIMLNVTGDPIVMDFGIAKIMGGTQHTATGAVLGTARYMSPEQIKGERIDPRTDIYSLGVTLFEMLGGRPPFEADSAMTLMMMHMTDPVPSLQDLRTDVPAGLMAVVNKSLAKDGNDRYQSAAELAAALRNMDKDAAVPLAAATVLESAIPKPADPDMTVLEPVTAEVADTPSSGVDTGAAAAAAAAAAGSTAPPPATGVPATGASAAPPQQSGGSRTLIYAAGGAILLLLIAIGVWAIFFRGSGDEEVAGGGGEVPTAIVDSTGTPDAQATIDAGVAADLQTRAADATQTAEAIAGVPTNTPPPTATEPVVPEDAIVASVDQVEGEVLMITAAGQEIPLTADTPVTEGSQFITGDDGQLTFSLDDSSIAQLIENSDMSLDTVTEDPTDATQQTLFTMVIGDLLLQQPDAGNELVVNSQAGDLLATLQNSAALSGAAKQAIAAKRLLQSDAEEAAMSLHLEESGMIVSCFSGECFLGDGSSLPAGTEAVVTADGGSAARVITADSESYQQWQAACDDCLAPPEGPAIEPPPTATTAPPTVAPLPTATIAVATPEPTTEPEGGNYAARISNIALQNGAYVVSYETVGYTEQLPGMHVHFYFDTVSEANAGVPGSGPWKLYGGPRPFTGYSESERPAGASSMCIRVANADHSIIFGSGNCYPLP